MKIMKPIATEEIPVSEDWMYEVKYDGFRAQLHWDTDAIQIVSRNGHQITDLFPEIVMFCREQQPRVQSLLPLVLDGELVVLNHPYQANFSLIQQRGRLHNKEKIEHAAHTRPAAFLAFDILQQENESLEKHTYLKRKKVLREVFAMMELPDYVDRNRPLSYIPAFTDASKLWDIVFENKGEGIVAKRTSSAYQAVKSHHDWYKVKNWRTIEAFLTCYNVENDYYTVSVFENEQERIVGKCKHGLSAEEGTTLKTFFTTKGKKQEKGYALPPAICAQIHTLDLYKEEMREPEFTQILVRHNVDDCTGEKLRLDLAMLPNTVEVTNTEKIFWPEQALTKGDLLIYMREIAPYMLPFLKERLLTVIRGPDGVRGEQFFQKHRPDYAPDFIPAIENGDETFTVCNDLNTLIWFANHGTIEYHTPFEKMSSDSPSEIVFDLDPPDAAHFSFAVKAALLLKHLLDDLQLISFVKTSGNKGLQVHIPIPSGSMSYDETAVLTKAIAETMVNARPEQFTTERLKRDRKGRLYIDYLQHAKGKTIITPYSPRLTEAGTIATPLFWEEVNTDLHPEQFTIQNAVHRVQTLGCPFASFFETGKKQHLKKIQNMINH